MFAFLTIFATAITAFLSPAVALLAVPIGAIVLTLLSWGGRREAVGIAYGLDARFTQGILLQSFCNGLAACGAAFLVGSLMHVTMLVS